MYNHPRLSAAAACLGFRNWHSAAGYDARADARSWASTVAFAEAEFDMAYGGREELLPPRPEDSVALSVVSSLNDPYSKYLTRDRLRAELEDGYDGSLGLGALVDIVRPWSLALAFDAKASVGATSFLGDEFVGFPTGSGRAASASCWNCPYQPSTQCRAVQHRLTRI